MTGRSSQGIPVILLLHDPTPKELEQVYFETILEKYSGHRASVASTLGISERNVYRLIQKNIHRH